MKRFEGAFAILCALLLAGCGDTEPAPEATPSTEDQPAAPALQPLPPEDASGVRNVNVTLTEWSVQLSQDSIPAGPVAFQVRNTGQRPHRFEVEGNQQEWETDNLNPGGEVTMSVNLSPGSYEVYCPIDSAGVNHRDRGMVTTLRVY